MSGAIPPLPNTSSWRGAQLKHRDNCTFTFYLPFAEYVTYVTKILHNIQEAVGSKLGLETGYPD
jgi:hypothetical protein